ncbi:hypothetical protein [Streptomyces sp. NPDC086023]|uniref:hypothetical protein n=1 Tax=Streptomyces sp. NPDC086023 TaxID=3365746 RepID=UPI0037CFEF79
MKNTSRLAVVLSSLILAGMAASASALASSVPTPPSPSPMGPNSVVSGDQVGGHQQNQNGHGNIHLGTGANHTLGDVTHNINISTSTVGAQAPQSTFAYRINNTTDQDLTLIYAQGVNGPEVGSVLPAGSVQIFTVPVLTGELQYNDSSGNLVAQVNLNSANPNCSYNTAPCTPAYLGGGIGWWIWVGPVPQS